MEKRNGNGNGVRNEKTWIENNKADDLEAKQTMEVENLLEKNVLPPLELLNMVKSLSPRVASFFAEKIASSLNFSYKEIYPLYQKMKPELSSEFIHRFEIGLIKRNDIPKYMAEKIAQETLNLKHLKLPKS